MKKEIEIIKQYCLNHGLDEKFIDNKAIKSCLLSMPEVDKIFIEKRNWIYSIFEQVVNLDGKYLRFQYSEDDYGSVEILWNTLCEVVPYTTTIEVTKYRPKE